MELEAELLDLWYSSNRAAEMACRAFGQFDQIRDNVRYLRRHYRSLGGATPPSFGMIETQLAYAAAYHPAHSHMYLSILNRQRIGASIFGSDGGPCRILLLGAGLAAECSAIVRWFDRVFAGRYSLLEMLQVDRIDWEPTRQSFVDPKISEAISAGKLSVSSNRVDLLSQDGKEFLTSVRRRFDVIFLSSVLTEMYQGGAYGDLIQQLRWLIADGARLVIIDHDVQNFEPDIAQLVSGLYVRHGRVKKYEIQVPTPNAWLAANILDGSDGCIPLRTYAARWMIVSNRPIFA